jgi:mono/diheme cytochrome c family protein
VIARRQSQLVRLGVLVMCALYLSGPSPVCAEEAATPRLRAAAAFFKRTCVRCHGQDGRGGPERANMPTIPNFTDPTWHQSRSNIQMVISILEGKDRLMPAHAGTVSEELAADLVAYVRAFNPAAKAAPVAATPVKSPSVKAAPVKDTPVKDISTKFTPILATAGEFDVVFGKLEKDLDDLRKQWDRLERAVPVDVSPSVPVGPSPPVPVGPSPPVPVVAAPGPGPDKSPVAAPSIADRRFTPEDAARGRELFMGRMPLSNGGAACIACHVVHGSGALEGGRLGPELTKVYERLGGRTALTAYFGPAGTPTMHPVYKEYPLKPEEVLSLAAYLEETDKTGVAEAAPVPVKYLLLGLGGTVLGLVTLNFLWGTWFRPRRRPALDGRLAAAMPLPNEPRSLSQGQAAAATPAARPDLAPVPEDYVAIGL